MTIGLSLRVGIDIGGTFTDFVVYHPDSRQIETFKLLSTPRDPAEAVLAGLEQITGRRPDFNGLGIVHGSTVA
ncbi:MAG: 5-oxoprolinase (ATP-hydrolyzing), partial [Chloroflexi bacterium]|nr:5-oxoprolinase (ATP-hydrolyzing) [Chloroflexota bacterium]